MTFVDALYSNRMAEVAAERGWTVQGPWQVYAKLRGDCIEDSRSRIIYSRRRVGEMNFADALELFDRLAPICTDKATFIFIYGREIT